jgi:uncharacterized protein (TIGR02099 family)
MLPLPRLSALPALLMRWIAWAVVGVLLLVGILWALLHFWIVPRISDLRPQFESMASAKLGLPVRIGQMQVESNGWAPVFAIDNLSVHKSDGAVALTLPKVRLSVSANSLLTLGVEQLMLIGADLDLRRTEDGQLWIAGLALPNRANTSSPAADWVFAQKELVLQEGTVRWTDALSLEPQRTVTMTDVQVTVRNSARQHDLRLSANPPEGWGSRFSASGQFRRNLLSLHAGRLQDWTGKLQAQLPEVDLALLGRSIATGWVLTSGHGSLGLDLDILRGLPIKATAQGSLAHLNFALTPESGALRFDNLQGRISAQQDAKGFEFATQDVMFQTPDGLRWPGGNLTLKYTYPQAKTMAKGRIEGDRLSLQALQSIATRMPLHADMLSGIQRMQVAGTVQNLKAQWEGEWPHLTSYEAKGRIDGLSTSPVAPSNAQALGANMPGMHNANVDFALSQSGGKLALAIEKGSVTLNGFLASPIIPIDHLKADLNWTVKDHKWQVPLWRLKLKNNDLSADMDGSWRMSKEHDSAGWLDLQGRIARVDAAQVYRYLPESLPSDVRRYVQESLLKGELSQVAVQIKGDLKDLPFASPKSGEFRFAGKVRDLHMAYVPARLQTTGEPPWPLLTGLNGDLVFERSGMKLSNASGKIDNLPISGLQAVIPDMAHAAQLEVTAETRNALAKDVLNLVQKSPLDQMLGASLHEATATGNVSGRVKLNLPLMALEKTRVQGNLVLSGNDLRIVPALPWMENAQGNLGFTETGFTVTGGSMRMLGGSVQVEGGSRSSSANTTEAPIALRVQGQVTALGLQQAHELAPLNKLAQRMSGSASYNGVIAFRKGHPEISLASNLQGLGLSLPVPLAKAPQDEMAMRLETRLLNEDKTKLAREQIQFSLGRILAATYVRDLSGDKPVVVQGSLGLGLDRIQAPPLPEQGVVANLALTRFSLDEWQAAWTGSLDNAAPTKTTGALSRAADDLIAATFLPTRIALQAQELVTQGRTLHNVVVGGSREGLLWRANLDAREFSGYLEYRQSSGANLGRVYARLGRLSLPPSADTVVEQLLESGPVDIPALDIVVEDVELRGKKLGRIEIEAVNTLASGPRNAPFNEWRLNKLNVTVPEAVFKATGHWVTAKSDNQLRSTEMNFRLDIDDAGALLNRLGTQDAMRSGKGRLEGQVAWNGSPLVMHYPSLAGRFNVNIARGQFLKADPGVAKLLGVLSLQALPRRLLFDFRDVFSEGFAYDVIRGDVSIDNGMASTKNLQMKGVNALVQMEGSSDIAKETQNLQVVILPEVDAGTASLLAGIAVNPVIGLSTFLAQLFLRAPLSKATTQSFVIDGTWSNPKVTKVHSFKPSSPVGVP